MKSIDRSVANAVRALTALAQDTRLSTFRALVVAGADGMTAGELVDALEVPAPTLSFHLKELLAAELVTQQRQGRHLRYRADFDRMNELMSFLTQHCCSGAPCAVAPLSPLEVNHAGQDLQRALHLHR